MAKAINLIWIFFFEEKEKYMKNIKRRPKTFNAYLRLLIKITNRYITKDAHLLPRGTVNFHKGANNAYKDALEQYEIFHSNKSFK